MRNSKIWYVYIVQGKDKSLYTGISTDVTRRVDEHNAKMGAKSLRGKLPVALVYWQRLSNQTEARKREASIKQWTRKYKLLLIEQFKAGLEGR